MKNSSDTIGNRTRDFPACSTVPQPTMISRLSNPLVQQLIRVRGQRNWNADGGVAYYTQD
jgi:hypothetical protein